VFALACVVGWQVVWNVTPALHTPLMSVTNAISGIIVIGGMLQLNQPPGSAAVLLGATAILLSTINIAGGFLVTQRMLRMFHR
jgi:NAD(P) transhydrogenase subunit alpha